MTLTHWTVRPELMLIMSNTPIREGEPYYTELAVKQIESMKPEEFAIKVNSNC